MSIPILLCGSAVKTSMSDLVRSSLPILTFPKRKPVSKCFGGGLFRGGKKPDISGGQNRLKSMEAAGEELGLKLPDSPNVKYNQQMQTF
jgi:hypothetical protein